MSVHLVGGGWSVGVEADVFGRFVEEAAVVGGRRGRAAPRIVVVAVRDGDGPEHAARLVAALRSAAGSVGSGGELDPVVVAAQEADAAAEEALAGDDAAGALLAGLLDVELGDADGLVVGGGLTPAYLAALRPHAEAVRALVAAGVPYLGFSAGSAIAAERALVGGWRIGGIEVSPEDGAEDLDEVTVSQGLGLVDVTIDVHAAQWGILSRLVAATEAGLAPGGVAIDEDTVLVVGEGGLVVGGSGNVWRVLPGETGVAVSTMMEQ
jgi:cyanophycinase